MPNGLLQWPTVVYFGMSSRTVDSTLILNLRHLPDMYVREALSDMRPGQKLNLTVRVQVTDTPRNTWKAHIEEVVPEGFKWSVVDPHNFDYSHKYESYSILGCAYDARTHRLQLVPPVSETKPPRYRYTLRMALIEQHYIDRGLLGGSRNGYKAPAWDNNRVNELCELMDISLFELGSMFVISKREMRRYYRNNSWPSMVALHFDSIEKSVLGESEDDAGSDAPPGTVDASGS